MKRQQVICRRPGPDACASSAWLNPAQTKSPPYQQEALFPQGLTRTLVEGEKASCTRVNLETRPEKISVSNRCNEAISPRSSMYRQRFESLLIRADGRQVRGLWRPNWYQHAANPSIAVAHPRFAFYRNLPAVQKRLRNQGKGSRSKLIPIYVTEVPNKRVPEGSEFLRLASSPVKVPLSLSKENGSSRCNCQYEYPPTSQECPHLDINAVLRPEVREVHNH